MSDKVGFLLDGQEVLTYDRSQALPDKQREYLDILDKQMDEGFILSDEKINKPNLQQKTQFIALNLVNTLLKEDDNTAIIMFTYLVNRMPDLKQARAKTKDSDSGQKVGVEFVFDEIKSEGQKIEFKAKITALAKEIVAFANASGGSLFLGISDDGKIVGIDDSNRLRSQIQDVANGCDPRIDVHIAPRGNVVEIIVPEGTDKPYRCKMRLTTIIDGKIG